MADTAAATDLSVRHADRAPPAPQPTPQPAPTVSGPPQMGDDGRLRPVLSPGDLATERAQYLAIFDANARLARLRGESMEGYSDQHRLEWAQRFDSAARVDGLEPAEVPTKEILDHHDRHLLPYAVRPEEFTPRFSGPVRELPAERLAGVQDATRSFAAAMQFTPELGTAVIEHIADIGPKLNGMQPEARTQWIAQQEQLGERMAGSPERFAEMKTLARQVLGGVAKGNELARDLGNSTVPVLESAWLAMTLAHHAKCIESFHATYPGKK